MGAGGIPPISAAITLGLTLALLPGLLVAPARAQLVRPGDKKPPCNNSTEHTCGPPGPSQICCNKQNFVCGVRADNGGPRCALCPQTCIMDCMSGFQCARDPADGCFKCLADPDGGPGDSYVSTPAAPLLHPCLLLPL